MASRVRLHRLRELCVANGLVGQDKQRRMCMLVSEAFQKHARLHSLIEMCVASAVTDSCEIILDIIVGFLSRKVSMKVEERQSTRDSTE